MRLGHFSNLSLFDIMERMDKYMKERIKICFFLGGLKGGGIGRVTSILVNEMIKNTEYELYVLCYSRIEKEDYIIDSRIHKSYFLEENISMTKAMLKGAVPKLKKYLQDNDIDILVSCGVLLSVLSISSCKGIKTKCINWEHSSMFNGNKDFKLQTIARRYAAKKSDLNIVLTDKTETAYIQKYRISYDKVKRIYNPVDPLAYRSKEYNTASNIIISVGRLSYQKKFEDVIKAASDVLDEHSNWIWHIYGEGEEKESLQNMIDASNLRNKVILKGRVPNIYDLYSQYAFIVMTSRYEGFPMTLLEAAGNRLPMISYDIETGPSEIIDDKRNGYLVEADNMTELVERVQNLMNDESLRKKMSQASYQTSLKFKLEGIVKEWETVFQMMLAKIS